MKKTILFSIASVFLFSCSNQTDVAREKIESHIDSFANDPGSYQFVGMEKPDTVRKSDTMFINDILVTFYKTDVEHYQDQVNYYSKMVKGSYGYIYQDSYKDYLEYLANANDKLNKEISKLNSQKKIYKKIHNTQMDSIAWVVYKLKFRIKNAAGGLILTSASVTFAPSSQSWGKIRMENPLKD
jgi:cell division protein FtsB